MSCYDPAPRGPRHEVGIGWDPCVANYFLQIVDREVTEEDSDQDRVIVWRGAGGYATQPDLDDLLEEAGQWALVPPELGATLIADREREGRQPWPGLLFVNGYRDVL